MPIAALEKTRFDEQQVLRIHVVSPRAEIQRAMGAAIHEITSALKEQGVTPSGPWFAHHHRRPTETFDFDVCFPVASPVQTSGRLENVAIPATEVVRTVYRGPYEGLVSAWPEFLKQLTAAGYNVRPDVFEVYLVGPAQTQDPEAWETGLNCPLAASAS